MHIFELPGKGNVIIKQSALSKHFKSHIAGPCDGMSGVLELWELLVGVRAKFISVFLLLQWTESVGCV